MVELIVSAVAAPVEHREPESLDFPGCRPVRITRNEIDDREDFLKCLAGTADYTIETFGRRQARRYSAGDYFPNRCTCSRSAWLMSV